MRKTVMAAALLLALSCPALGGIIHTPGSPTPPPEPPPSSAVQEPTDDATINGEIPTPGIMPTPGVSDMLTETALDLLAVLPTLL